MNFAPRVWPAVLMPATSTSPTAPSRATASEPAALAATTASVSEDPRSSAAIIAPANASPAPVRSRTLTCRTPSATSVIPSGLMTTAPAAPRFTTSGVPHAAAAATAGPVLSVPVVTQRDVQRDLAAQLAGLAQEVGHAVARVQVAPARPGAAQHAAPAVDLRLAAQGLRGDVRDEGPVTVEVQDHRDPGRPVAHPQRRGEVHAPPGAELGHDARAEIVAENRAQPGPRARGRGRAGAADRPAAGDGELLGVHLLAGRGQLGHLPEDQLEEDRAEQDHVQARRPPALLPACAGLCEPAQPRRDRRVNRTHPVQPAVTVRPRACDSQNS